MQRLNRGNLLATIKELKKYKRPKPAVSSVAVQAICPTKVGSSSKISTLKSVIARRRNLALNGVHSDGYILSKDELLLFDRLVSIQNISCNYEGKPWGELFVHWFYVGRNIPQWTKCEIFHINMFRYFSIPKKMSVIHIRLAYNGDIIPKPVVDFVKLMESYGCSVELKIVPQKDNWEHDTIKEAAEYAVSTGKFIYYTHFKGVSRIKDSFTRNVIRGGTCPLDVLYWCYIMYRGLFLEFTGHSAVGPISCNRINKEYLFRDLSWSTNPTYQYIGSFQGFNGKNLNRAFKRLGLDRYARDKIVWWGGRYTVEMFLCLVFLENEVYTIAEMENENTAYGMYRNKFCPRFLSEFKVLFNTTGVSPKEPNNSVAICAIAKNEDLYIAEWVKYYKNLGVSHIYIYDNNDCETDVMQSISNLPFVTVIPVYGEGGLRSIGYQVGAYTQAYNTFGKLYGWMGFFDIDEFVSLDNGLNIPSFLSQPIYLGTTIVRLHWRYYGDNSEVFYNSKPVTQRFIEPAPIDVKYSNRNIDENMYVKSFVRTGYSEMRMDVHSPRFFGAVCRNSKGCFGLPTKTVEPVVLDNARVNHYGTKSIEEYILRRMPNADKNVSPNGACSERKIITAKDRLDWFFNVNEVTAEKLEVIRKMLPDLRYVPPKN